MFLLFDALPLQSGSRERGIGRYTAGLLAGLRAVRPDWQIELILHAHLPPPDAAAAADLPTRTIRYPLPFRPRHRDVLELFFTDWVAAQKPDWVLCPSPFEMEGAGLRPLHADHCIRTSAVLYDLIPMVFPDRYMTGRVEPDWYAARFRAAAGMDRLLAISEATASDAVQYLGIDSQAVVNIRGAADACFAPLPAHQQTAAERRIRLRYGLERSFILYVGGDDWRKNMIGAIEGFAALPSEIRAEHDLVLACYLKPERAAMLMNVANKLGVAERVKFTGYVPDEDLLALYHACRVFFFPSRYEGLGLPVLEAFRCGAPVVCSNNSSLPEYGGAEARYCDPTSPTSMAAALAETLAIPKHARRAEREQFAARFTWEDTAERAAHALERNVPATPRARRRIAWVSPAPPAATGIADYAVDVSKVLVDRFEIEWIVDPAGMSPSAELMSRFPVFTVADVEARHAARPFDLFVYHIGNQHFHTYMLPLLRKYPGLVVLHDLNLGELFKHATETGVWPRNTTEPVPAVLDGATGVLVHSAMAWKQVRKLSRTPASIVPLIAPISPLRDRAKERERLSLPADDFLVCTLGIAGAAKRVPAIVEAISALRSDVKLRTRLLIVGECPEHDRDILERLIAQLHLENQVEFRGRVPLEDFTAYAAAADVCVQLRYPSHGETSAALMRALSAGTACIVSDAGTMAELPDTAVMKVRSPDHDAADLTALFTHLFHEPDLRKQFGANGHQHTLETAGPDAVTAGYASVIEDAISRLDSSNLSWQTRVLDAVQNLPRERAAKLIRRWAHLRLAVKTGTLPRTKRPHIHLADWQRTTGAV